MLSSSAEETEGSFVWLAQRVPGLLSLVVLRGPGNMQGLLLATFLLAAPSQVSSPSLLLPLGDYISSYFF